MNMDSQTHAEIVKDLLRVKHSMEKAHDFAAKSMRAAEGLDPVGRIPALQLHKDILVLKRARGTAKKAAAGQLAHSLLVHHRSLACQRCGARLTPGKAFCGQCGQKTQ
jgi:hypothetical protein